MRDLSPTLTPWQERFRERFRPDLDRIDSPVRYVQVLVFPNLLATARLLGSAHLLSVLRRMDGNPGTVEALKASLRAATGGEFGEPQVHPHHCGDPGCVFDGGGYLGFIAPYEDFGPAFHAVAMLRPLGRTDEDREVPDRG